MSGLGWVGSWGLWWVTVPPDKCCLLTHRNAESVTYFWQNWNIPVHKWCLRWVLA